MEKGTTLPKESRPKHEKQPQSVGAGTMSCLPFTAELKYEPPLASLFQSSV